MSLKNIHFILVRPQMGENIGSVARAIKNFNIKDQFYFVHSYCAKPKEKNVILASYNFGGHLIPSIVAKDNIIGCQFHPEKSGPFGLNLIKNFISLFFFILILT